MYNDNDGILSSIFFNAESIQLLDEYGELLLDGSVLTTGDTVTILGFTMPTINKAVITEISFGIKTNLPFALTTVKPDLRINGTSIWGLPESYINGTQTKNYNSYNEKVLLPINKYHSDIEFILPRVTALNVFSFETYFCRIKGYYYSEKI